MAIFTKTGVRKKIRKYAAMKLMISDLTSIPINGIRAPCETACLWAMDTMISVISGDSIKSMISVSKSLVLSSPGFI